MKVKDDLNLHPLFVDNDVRGVVFDLDGTLIDSVADILHGMRLTFEQAGLGSIPDDYIPDNMHGTCEGIMRYIAADLGWNGPADFSYLKTLYFANAATVDFQRTQLYAGALDVLEACRNASLPLGICTNKAYAGALIATRKFGIHGMFDFITGADTWAQAKPSPVPLLETIRMLGLQPEQCLYFGDTSVDAECAHAAGVRFVLHESGYGDRNLANQPQHFTFRQWNELLADQIQTA